MEIKRTQYQGNPFRLVTNSPWPLFVGLSLFGLVMSATLWMHGYSSGGFLASTALVSLVFIMMLWFRDVNVEGTYQGHHTLLVQKGLELGFLMFIVSEVMTFFGIFWGFFHSALNPSVELGSVWPPVGVEALDYLEVPLLNTVLLLSSGASVTWAHHKFLGGNRSHALLGMAVTILLALTFTAYQAKEYIEAPFTMSDGVYGSTFFASTGMHGIHVIIGTLLLISGVVRIYNYNVTQHHHIGYESAIIYYHFVDVVWLFLYVAVYWWGGQ